MRKVNLTQKRPFFPRLLTPAVAFGLCLALTVGATYFALFSARAENLGRFERGVANFVTSLRSRMNIYTNAVVYTRNLFDIHPDLTMEEFRRFVQGMELRQNYPGIQTLGYAERMTVPQADRRLKALKIVPELRNWGEDSKATVYPILYLERLHPTSTNNASGANLAATPERRAAMDRARDSGEPVATDRVTPFQPDAGRNPYAFLLIVPRYRQGLPLKTVEERRSALIGFVYAGFRVNNLFGTVADDMRVRIPFLVQIYDGDKAEPQRLMYSNADGGKASPILNREVQFEFARHTWTLVLSAPEGFLLPSATSTPYLLFIFGLLLSLAVALALRRSQSARREADAANQAKSIFLANISHEVRTPLGVMLGFTELALEQNDKVEREKSLNTVLRNGQELTRILGDVLDVSKVEARSLTFDPSTFSLTSMVNETIEAWRPIIAAKGVEFEAEVASDLPSHIVSDQIRIKQVLTNLLANAVKFTERGKIRFHVGYNRNDQRIHFIVADTGIGIAEKNRSRLFVPFSQGDSSITRRFGGSGLGLALSREIARGLGGSLVLQQSHERVGSSFELSVPFTMASENSATKKTTMFSGDLSGRKILLVEDSEDNQILISMILSQTGALVSVAKDGQQGVEKARQGGFDLILMDIQMPIMDGLAALDKLKELGIKTPVIALTAHALREERERALARGFSAYLTKPINRAELIEISAQTLSN
ncbi:MAG: CHASE domain-containing protein [Bdellovibrionales bacterium]|nr:CHASE domain-containing protein [Bdellovibrionales bacterium]